MTYGSERSNAPNEVFRALADPTRRALLEHLLQHGAQSVGTLTRHAGISQPAVSQHLSVLKRAGMVKDEPAGRVVQYRADPHGFGPLVNWIEFYASFWTARLDQLGTLLDRTDE